MVIKHNCFKKQRNNSNKYTYYSLVSCDSLNHQGDKFRLISTDNERICVGKNRCKTCSNKERIPWNKGIPLTLEVKKKLSDKMRGKIVPLSVRSKISESSSGPNSNRWNPKQNG
jgi:hypothetical protein